MTFRFFEINLSAAEIRPTFVLAFGLLFKLAAVLASAQTFGLAN